MHKAKESVKTAVMKKDISSKPMALASRTWKSKRERNYASTTSAPSICSLVRTNSSPMILNKSASRADTMPTVGLSWKP